MEIVFTIECLIALKSQVLSWSITHGKYVTTPATKQAP